MEKVYVLISRYESSDEVFTTVHKTFKGAIESLNEDYRESRGFDGDIYRFEDSEANQDLYYNVGGICYEILESKVYEQRKRILINCVLSIDYIQYSWYYSINKRQGDGKNEKELLQN